MLVKAAIEIYADEKGVGSEIAKLDPDAAAQAVDDLRGFFLGLGAGSPCGRIIRFGFAAVGRVRHLCRLVTAQCHSH